MATWDDLTPAEKQRYIDAMYASDVMPPPRADAAIAPTVPTTGSSYRFGDVGRDAGNEALQAAYAQLASAVNPQSSNLLDVATNYATGTAGGLLSGAIGLGQKAGGYAADVLGAGAEALGSDRWSRGGAAQAIYGDMGAGSQAAGLGTEANALGLLSELGAGKYARGAIADRLNQTGPVPTMYSNPIMRAPFDMGRGIGDNGGPFIEPTLMDALSARAQQMELKPADRIQPSAGGAGILDRDYMTPAPSGILPDLSQRYVRNPDAASVLPKGDRSRVLVDRANEIADTLANRIQATGQMDADTRYFYHPDGPIYRAAKASGLSDTEAANYLRDLGDYVAATSPRTKVEENLRNATLAMAKQSQGIPFRDVIGVGTGGISEKGYPMMTGKGGIHGILLDDVINNGGMNVATNPKPSNFGPNIAGNRSGVTVDTHAIRGTLQTLNEMDAGSVPEGFILPKFREQYAKNPSVLTPDMIDDTLGGQMIGDAGSRSMAQTEYPVFADIWHKAANKLGVSPAEAQSMGWFGFGDQTNLGSARKTPVDIFDERLDVTAKALGITPKQAAEGVFRRQIPLLSAGGAGLLGAGMMPDGGNQQ